MKKLTKNECITEMTRQYIGNKTFILLDLFVSFWYWETDFNLNHLLNKELCQFDLKEKNGGVEYVIDYCLKDKKKIKRTIVYDSTECVVSGIMNIYEIMHSDKNLDNYDILYNFITDLKEFEDFVGDLNFNIDEEYF